MKSHLFKLSVIQLLFVGCVAFPIYECRVETVKVPMQKVCDNLGCKEKKDGAFEVRTTGRQICTPVKNRNNKR